MIHAKDLQFPNPKEIRERVIDKLCQAIKEKHYSGNRYIWSHVYAECHISQAEANHIKEFGYVVEWSDAAKSYRISW